MTRYANFDARQGTPQAVRFVWSMETEADEGADLSYLEDDSRYDDVEDEEERARYLAEDAARLADYGDGWDAIGVIARLDIFVPIGGNSFTTYTLRSAGLWGVESDSGDDYIASVYEDEKAQLWDALRKIGLATLAFDALATSREV